MSKYRLACLTLLLVAPGCSFDPPALGPGDPRGDAGEPADGRPPPDAAPDASPGCQAGELRLVLHIGGKTVTDTAPEPYVEALVGDVVEISAAGSCAGDDTPSYAWTITPDNGILATADPALADGREAFSVYPTTAGDYTLTLTVRAPDGTSMGTSVLAIRAHEWLVAPVPFQVDMGAIHDLSVGGGSLWIAAENGPFFRPLGGALGAYAPVVVNGNPVPNDLEAVLYDERTSFLWFGRSADENGPWRLNMTRTPPESIQIQFNVPEALGGTAQTLDIAANGTDTIVMATSRGITAVDGTEGTFAARIRPDGQDPVALAIGAGRRLAGSRQLYDLDDDSVHDIGVGGSDNKIVAMDIDAGNEVLWIGTIGLGVVAFDLRDDATQTIYTESNSELGSDTVRALLVENQAPYAGDVWVATDKGVSRYIRRRDTWIHMDEDHGLTGHLDLESLAIDRGENRRVVYAGSTVGVVYMGDP